MSKKRLIPKLQLKTASYDAKKMVLVITKQFGDIIEIGNPVSQAKIYQDQAADELVFVNIDKYNKNIDVLAHIINQVSQEIFMPITVGGGITEVDDFRNLLKNGADKITINTAAVQNPSFITIASDKFGAQCVVISIDYKLTSDGSYKVFVNGGKTETELDPVGWAIEAEKRGAGEILLCCIDNDGMKGGLNLDVTRDVATAVSIPVITSGGCGLARHFSDGFILGKADAVAAGTFFAHRDQNLMQTRSHIRNAGVNIRIHN
jgi:cyclase